MQIAEKDKVNILINLLNERYNASHKIRERSLKFTIWILGFAIAFLWILLNETSFTFPQKWILTFLVIVIGGIAFWFLIALEKGLNNNRNVMIDLEDVLGCYKKGTYIASKTIYPNEYKEKEIRSWFAHFKSIYILLIPIAILLICLIWLKPTQQHQKNMGPALEKQKIEKIDDLSISKEKKR